MSILNHSILTKNYGKLFAKTNSVSATWRIPLISGQVFPYTIVDNGTLEIIKIGLMTGGQNSIFADLSASSGDTSIYVDVDIDGDNVTSIRAYYNVAKFTYIDFSVFPKLKKFLLYNGSNQLIQVVGSDLLNLEEFRVNIGSNWLGLDFSQSTKIKKFEIYINNLNTDIPLNISLNSNLEKYVNKTLNTNFNLSNHLKLRHLEYRNNDTTLDIRINNVFLPQLRNFIEVVDNPSKNYDFTNRDFSLITSSFLSLSSNIVGKNLLTSLTNLTVIARNLPSIDLTGIPNLNVLKVGAWGNYTNNIIDTIILGNLPISSFENYRNNLTGILDLTNLQNLQKYKNSYPNSLTDILINNGLNSQITQFKTLYDIHTTNVRVDNPTDANNGVAPYLPTVWKEYLTYNSWNFI